MKVSIRNSPTITSAEKISFLINPFALTTSTFSSTSVIILITPQISHDSNIKKALYSKA